MMFVNEWHVFRAKFNWTLRTYTQHIYRIVALKTCKFISKLIKNFSILNGFRARKGERAKWLRKNNNAIAVRWKLKLISNAWSVKIPSKLTYANCTQWQTHKGSNHFHTLHQDLTNCCCNRHECSHMHMEIVNDCWVIVLNAFCNAFKVVNFRQFDIIAWNRLCFKMQKRKKKLFCGTI